MATKSIRPQLVQNMADFFPEFHHIKNEKRFVVFRKVQNEGMYQFLHFQVDYKSAGIALNSAVTYNPEWRGQPASPLGIDAGIENIKQNSRVVNALDCWYFCRPDFCDLEVLLKRINTDILKFIIPNLKKDSAILLNDRILQYALKEAKNFSVSPVDFAKEIENSGFYIKNIKNPVFLSFVDKINEAFRNEKSFDIARINKIACDILYYGIREAKDV